MVIKTCRYYTIYHRLAQVVMLTLGNVVLYLYMSETYTPQDKSDIKDAAGASKRMGLVEAWQDLNPKEKQTLKRAGAVVATGMAVAGALAGPAVVEGIGDAYENSTTPDQVVAHGTIELDQGAGLLEEVQVESKEIIDSLELAGKIDPAKVDLSSIPLIVEEAGKRSMQLSGDTVLQAGQQFELLLVDEGATYKFELAPLQNAQVGIDLDTQDVQLPDVGPPPEN